MSPAADGINDTLDCSAARPYGKVEASNRDVFDRGQENKLVYDCCHAPVEDVKIGTKLMTISMHQPGQSIDPPLIGITTYGRDADNKFSLPGEYVDAVRRAGGAVLLMPPGEPALDALLQQLDGLILAGGGDLDPARYGGACHETIYMLDPERDASELAMVHRIVLSGLPTLGICRGAQVVNVALGGTLFEHLPDEVGDSIQHRLPPRDPTVHAVALEPSSQLAYILQSQTISPASWHHQAIRDMAECLHVAARAPDGTIEAAEMRAHPWLITVQWHPEITAGEDPTQQRLFDAFVAACLAERPARKAAAA